MKIEDIKGPYFVARHNDVCCPFAVSEFDADGNWVAPEYAPIDAYFNICELEIMYDGLEDYKYAEKLADFEDGIYVTF